MLVWKDIKGYKGLYQISNSGKLKSLNYMWKWRKKILRASAEKRWYKRSTLTKNWKNKIYLIHRLVAQAFLWLDINNPKILVCHKDDNPKNNNVNNLFLGISKDNVQDMISKWRSWVKKEVNQYTIDWKFIKKWGSMTDVRIKLWITQSWISFCCNWLAKTAGWYKWEYFTK